MSSSRRWQRGVGVYPQMVTVDDKEGGGVFETPKYDDVIWAQPIMSLDNITVQPHTQLNELFKYEI